MTTRAELRADKTPRPGRRGPRFWIPVAIVLLLVVIALAGFFIGKPIYDRAMTAKSSLEKALPLAATAKDQILSGDSEGAQATAAQLSALTADAREQTDDGLWKGLEWVPVVGPNLHAVRTAAVVTDDLVTGALTPISGIGLSAFAPVNGAIDIAAVSGLQGALQTAADSVDTAVDDLSTINRDALIPQVQGAVDKLTSAVSELQPVVGPAAEVLSVLPAALGADGPRNYLAIFQNNAEARSAGGNPAALVMIQVDQGRITLGQQASSSIFKNGRPDTVTELNPETAALYGDNVGRWIPDATMTPDFSETSAIMRAWWAEEIGTPVDAVISFDPVALSYLLEATGPVTVPAEPVDVRGETIQVIKEPVTVDAKNAVQFLLSDVYWQYETGSLQDAVFAATTRSVFEALTSGAAQPLPLINGLTRAVDEGRLLYTPVSEAEAELVGYSKLSGRLPETNSEATVLGAYVNDTTTSKLDYYMQLDVAASTTQCTDPAAPAFSLTTTLTNTLQPDLVDSLPYAIAPGKYYPEGDVATTLVFYGPVGSTAASVAVDGVALDAEVLPHLGRPAVKVPVYNTPGQSHVVDVQFSGAPGEYGPLEVRHTPMARASALDVAMPGCS